MRTPSLALCLGLLGCNAVSSGGFDPDASLNGSDAPPATDLGARTDGSAARDVPPSVDTGSPAPGDPATRGTDEVCARFRAESAPARAAPGWTPGAMACDPGTLSAQTRSAAVQSLNLFRWLAGLGPVGEDATRHASSQACAVMMERNGMLSHTPPNSWMCWSEAGYDAASHGNLLGGRGVTTNAWNAIERWIDDRNDLTRTLGHRRWMLYPTLGDVGYGQTSAFACLYVLGGFRGSRTRPWVAWPNAGPVPAEVIPPSWTFSTQTLGWTEGVSAVRVTRDGAPVAITAVARRAPNYGDDTVSWDVPGVTPGAVYAVEITGIAMGTVRYDVRPVACP